MMPPATPHDKLYYRQPSEVKQSFIEKLSKSDAFIKLHSFTLPVCMNLSKFRIFQFKNIYLSIFTWSIPYYLYLYKLLLNHSIIRYNFPVKLFKCCLLGRISSIKICLITIYQIIHLIRQKFIVHELINFRL